MKLKEITPKAFYCGIAACPAIFETGEGSYVIVGKRLSADIENELEGRVGANEFAIEVPKELLSDTRGQH